MIALSRNLTMAPKKQTTAAAPKAPARSSRTTKASTTATATATTKKSTAATTNGTTTKANTTAKKTTTAPAKAKASEPAKSRKTKTTPNSTTSPPAPKKRKAESVDEESVSETKKPRITKPAVVPKPKPKNVINSAPTTRLNVYVCGEGSSGELGLGPAKNAIDVKRPRLNPHLPADKVGVVQVAVGGMHCIGLTHDNKILTWGVNDQGALGRSTAWEGGYKDIEDANKSDDSDDDSDDDTGLNPHESTPTAIPSESFAEGTVFVEVAAGDSSSFALTDDGLVYGWGTFRVSLTHALI